VFFVVCYGLMLLYLKVPRLLALFLFVLLVLFFAVLLCFDLLPLGRERNADAHCLSEYVNYKNGRKIYRFVKNDSLGAQGDKQLSNSITLGYVLFFAGCFDFWENSMNRFDPIAVAIFSWDCLF
jgi:hypothetical protein